MDLTLRAIFLVLAVIFLSMSVIVTFANPNSQSIAKTNTNHDYLQSYVMVAENSGLAIYVYPRYREEMDAGEIADEIREELGFKLKADFGGDVVDGSVTVASNDVIIIMPVLSTDQKQILDKIVQNHYSEKLAGMIEESKKERLKPPMYPQEEELTTGKSKSSPAYETWYIAGDYATSWISTTSTSFVDVPDLGITLYVVWPGDVLSWVSMESYNTEGRLDMRIMYGDYNTPIDICYFGRDYYAIHWIRTLYGYRYLSWGTYWARPQWRVSTGTGYGWFRIFMLFCQE